MQVGNSSQVAFTYFLRALKPNRSNYYCCPLSSRSATTRHVSRCGWQKVDLWRASFTLNKCTQINALNKQERLPQRTLTSRPAIHSVLVYRLSSHFFFFVCGCAALLFQYPVENNNRVLWPIFGAANGCDVDCINCVCNVHGACWMRDATILSLLSLPVRFYCSCACAHILLSYFALRSSSHRKNK